MNKDSISMTPLFTKTFLNKRYKCNEGYNEAETKEE